MVACVIFSVYLAALCSTSPTRTIRTISLNAVIPPLILLQYSKNTTANQISRLSGSIQVCTYAWILLTSIDTSLIRTLSNERRLKVEGAEMGVEFLWQSDGATKMQKVLYLFLSYLFLCLSICLPDFVIIWLFSLFTR